MMDTGERVAVASFVIFVVCLLVGVLYSTHMKGREFGRRQMQKEAVEIGVAEYNGQTGEWQWKETK